MRSATARQAIGAPPARTAARGSTSAAGGLARRRSLGPKNRTRTSARLCRPIIRPAICTPTIAFVSSSETITTRSLSVIAVVVLHLRPGSAEPHSSETPSGGAKRILDATAIDGHYRTPGAGQDSGRHRGPVTAPADRAISGQPVDGIREAGHEAQDRARDDAVLPLGRLADAQHGRRLGPAGQTAWPRPVKPQPGQPANCSAVKIEQEFWRAGQELGMGTPQVFLSPSRGRESG